MDLIDAIMENKLDMVQSILSQGVDVHRCDDSDSITPLHHAVAWSDIKIVFQLLSFGADPNAIAENGTESAMALACHLKKWDIVNLFLMANKSLLVH